jgi:RHS repeat-associated protein
MTKWALRTINIDVQKRHQQETTNQTNARVLHLRYPKNSYASNTNRLTQAGATAVTVDAEGNLTAQGSRTYTYNALNRLVRAYEGSTQIAGYTYNGLGQRVSKQAGNATASFVYGIEGQLLVETSGTTAREYLYLNGELLAVMDQAVAAGSPTVMVTTVPALLGRSLNVTWSGIANPTAYDWVGVYVPGSSDYAYLDWAYTNGGNAGSVNVTLTDPSLVAGGTYEAHLYADDGFTLLAKSASFVVNPTGTVVAVTSAPAVKGQSITAKWSGIATPTTWDWVGIYTPGSNDYAYLDWAYTNGGGAGTVSVTLTDPSIVAGATYEARLYANDGFTLLAKSPPFTVVAGASGSYTLYYVHNDHLGAPQVLTDEVGAVVWRATYDPFGQATVTTSTITNNLRYPGQYFDSETGLYYNMARYYDPKIGRYITSDPIGLRGGLNTYLYARANPLRYVDPSGLGAAGVAGEVITYVGGAAAVGGLATGNPLLFYGGLGVAAVGGALQVYDTHQEGEEAKNAIDKAQELANKIKERQNEEQQKIDKLFPPKSTPPNCPNGQSR